jgi:hypothetical protein
MFNYLFIAMEKALIEKIKELFNKRKKRLFLEE